MQNPTDNQVEMVVPTDARMAIDDMVTRPWCQQHKACTCDRQETKTTPENQFPMMTADRSRVAGPPRQLLVGTVKNPKVGTTHVGTMQMMLKAP
jgi:hypothetical protein